MSMFVKVKLTHPDAKLPSQKIGDVGWDLTSVESGNIPAGKVTSVSTGVVLAESPFTTDIHKSVIIKVEGRSGLAFRHAVFPVGGIIDPGYRGEISVMLYNGGDKDYRFEKGDRIAQLVIYDVHAKTSSNKTQFLEVDTVHPSHRGDKGFGSSGR